MQKMYNSPFKCQVRQTAGFPYYPSGKKHSGVDYVPIDKTIQTNWHIYSPCDGVANVFYNSIYGNYVVISLFDDIHYILLAHFDTISVKNNSKVTKNQFIGISGNTGNSTGRHLHIEYYKVINGKKVLYNPDEYIDFYVRSDELSTLWKNGSTPERLYICAEHAYHQYDDVFHLSLPPRFSGDCLGKHKMPDNTYVYLVQVKLGTGLCVGYVKYRGGVT